MFKINRICIFTAVLILTMCVHGQHLSDGLIVHFPLDGTAIDVSGNELNGTLNGPEPATDRFGYVNGALHFNGSNDYIEMPLNEMLQPPVPVSFAFWVKTESSDEFKNKFFRTDYQDDNYSGCWMSLNSNSDVTINFGKNAGFAGPNFRRTKIANQGLVIGEWVHLAGVIRGALDMSLYINGEEVDGYYDGTGSTTIGYSGASGKIGCVPPQTASPNTKYFQGTMDDFAMWGRGLSSIEILEVYNNGINISAIAETEVHQINVYPNPCQRSVNVKCQLNENRIKFELYDQTGNLVHDQIIDPNGLTNISLENVSKGLYLYRIVDRVHLLRTGKLIVK